MLVNGGEILQRTPTTAYMPALAGIHFMRFGLTILVAICSLTLVFGTESTVIHTTDSTVRVLVLPPFDEIANAGISPDIRSIIESVSS